MKNLLLVTLLLLFSFAITAADENEETAVPNNEQAETKQEKPKRSTVSTPDSFDPTETLSQDVPTAFPVDI